MSILFIYKTPNKCLFNNINSHYMLEIQGWFERKLCIPSAKGLLCFQISVPHVGIKTSRLKVTQENMVARGNCYWLIYVVILRFPPCFPPKYYFSYLMLTTVWEYYSCWFPNWFLNLKEQKLRYFVLFSNSTLKIKKHLHRV